VPLPDSHGMPLRRSASTARFGYQSRKRVLDVVIALLGVILTSPLMALVVLLVKCTSPGPVIFRQSRVGRGGIPFIIYKFRSMHTSAPHSVETRAGDPHITRVGRLLRATSLDELPQLFNVLAGSMSLVGPRPSLLEEVLGYDGHQVRRLDVLPGITGYAQVRGRAALPFEERMQADVWYVDHANLRLDLTILLQTVSAVIRGEGLYPLENDGVDASTKAFRT
jgi:lipopolysaccharide/colanic/teichoic acid biosynthesis glycosyltransferase